MVADKEDQQKHLALLNDHIKKYKEKIRELTNNNEGLISSLTER